MMMMMMMHTLHFGLEKQPHILDPVTVLTATNLSFITPSYKIPIGLYHYPWFIFPHCIALQSFLVLYCIVLLYSALLFV